MCYSYGDGSTSTEGDDANRVAVSLLFGRFPLSSCTTSFSIRFVSVLFLRVPTLFLVADSVTVIWVSTLLASLHICVFPAGAVSFLTCYINIYIYIYIFLSSFQFPISI